MTDCNICEIENWQLCLTNAAHEHFIAQTGKKSKTAHKNFYGATGPSVESRNMGPRKTNTHCLQYLKISNYLLRE